MPQNSRSLRSFEARCAEMAAAIRAGLLVRDADAGFSAIHPRAHAALAEMNDAGLLTFDSQSGDDASERAYVDGVMPVARARRFSAALNMGGDAVCIVLAPDVPEGTEWHTIPVTRRRDPQTGAWESETRLPLYLEARGARFEVNDALGRRGARRRDTDVGDLRIVASFDARWGRDAMAPQGGLFPQVLRALRRTV